MSEPLSTGAAKVAEEMLKEVQSAVNKQDQLANSQQSNVQFAQVMETQQVGQIQQTRPGADSTNIIRAATNAQMPDIPAIGQAADTTPAISGLQRIMEDVMQGQNKLEEIINLGLSGRNFSTPELLAMQAGVYRFTQELELTSKVVEKATSTIKQTMNTQV